MKKLLNLMGLLLLVLVIAFPVYAEEVSITEENLSQLKGKWEGYRRGMSDRGMIFEAPTDLEIFNDTPPFKCEFVYYDSKEGGILRIPFNKGFIEEGKFFLKWDKQKKWIRLTLHISKKGKMELRGKNNLGWDYFLYKN